MSSSAADGRDGNDDEVVTWHHGLMAQWWANFNLDGPEIEFFRPHAQAGQPALDAACGTGRLLVPWVTDGLDVDGVDASADMIAACREAARRAGRSPALYVQPLHRLELPRRYGAIVCCGGFGLGATREQDLEGLRRMFDHLKPGGVLALDYEREEFDADQLRSWELATPDSTPPPPEDRRLAPDGFQYALRHRLVAVDVDARQVTREMQAWQWASDGALLAHEIHALVANLFTPSELVHALGEAGFDDVRVVGGYHGGEPTGDEEFLVYIRAARTGRNVLVVVSFDVDRYLARISYDGPREPAIEALTGLEVAHLMAVPFENLHVFHHLGVRVDVDWSYVKIVEQRRGGWCFELNGCFAGLLSRLGYSVDLLACRTFEPATGALSAQFDHLTLLVHVGRTAHLVDVGWGDNPLSPLPAEAGEYATRPRPSRIETDASALRLIELVEHDGGTTTWELQYEASRRPRRLGEFDARSRYLQTTPGLSWTEKPLVTRATSARGGRVTLHRDRLRIRDDDLAIRDQPVTAVRWEQELRTWFGMSIPTAA